MRKTSLIEQPSLILATLGGAAGAVFFGALLHLAPAAGAPSFELAASVGGLFTAGAAALWWGAILLFLIGWLALPLLMAAAWTSLPGHPESAGGTLLKGSLVGLGLWVVAGLLLPVLGTGIGLFAAAGGMGAAGALLIASLGYGLVAAAIAGMGRGITPLETLGWEGHGAGRAG